LITFAHELRNPLNALSTAVLVMSALSLRSGHGPCSEIADKQLKVMGLPIEDLRTQRISTKARWR
jgi:hypothetical protein